LSLRWQRRIDEALVLIPVLALDTPADLRYAELRCALERAGTPIGANDLLIAAHALALGCILVSANEREFRRVPDLTLENWLS
jgi:tRNA(fMet)-specific endonuclease VapC